MFYIIKIKKTLVFNKRSTIEDIAVKYDKLTKYTDEIDDKVELQNDIRRNITSALLRTLNNVSNKLDKTRQTLDARTRPKVEALEKNLSAFVGQVGSEILKLQAQNGALSSELKLVNSTLSRNELASQLNQNNTFKLNRQLIQLNEQLSELRGNY